MRTDLRHSRNRYGPGLGIDVDLSILEEYPYVDGPWTEFHYDE